MVLFALLAGSALASQEASVPLRYEANWKSCYYVVETKTLVQNPRSAKSRDKAVEDARKTATNRMIALISATSIAGKDSGPVIAKNPVLKKKILGIVNTTKAAARFVNQGAKTAALISLKIPIFGTNAPGSLIINNSAKPEINTDSQMDDSQSAVMQPVISVKPPEANNKGNGYTSLILDASGYKVERSMSPRILKACGDLLWDGSNASIELVEEFGIAAYSKSLDSANRNPRCGLRPLIVKVVNTCGIKSKDVIISDDDAKLVADENLKCGFLDNLNVIIVSN